MNNQVQLKGFTLSLADDGQYDFKTLPEELCRQMCDCEDAGQRYHPSSRYTFITQYFKDYNDIPFGTARAAVQSVLIRKLGFKMGRKIKIEHPKA